MRSGTSFFDVTLFKKNMARWWPIWASYLLIWLLVLPVSMLTDMPLTGMDYIYAVADACELNLLFAVSYGLMSAMAMFSHLYSSRSANFYGALPVRREGIFLTQYLSGLAFTVIPGFTVAVLTALVGVTGGSENFSAIFYWFVMGFGEMLFFYSLAVICGMFAGHILAVPAFYAIFNFIAIALWELIDAVLEELYYGFAGLSDNLRKAVMWLTPVVKFENMDRLTALWQSDLSMGENWFVFGVYSLSAVLLTACAFLLYRRRRLESAGDVVAVSPMRPVFKYGVAVCAGLFLGYITSSVLGSSTLMATILIWAVAGYFAAQMILDKTFRVLKKRKGALGVAVAFAAVFVVVGFDLTGFETRIPEAADVESARFRVLSGYSMGDDSTNTVTVTDPDEIEKVIALHRCAVLSRDRLDADRGRSLTLDVTYSTKNGTMSRRYTYPYDVKLVNTPGTTANALESIYSDRGIAWKTYGFDKLHEAITSGGRLEIVDYRFDRSDDTAAPELQYAYFRNGNWLSITNYSDMTELLNAVEADFRAGNIGRTRVDSQTEFREWTRSIVFRYSSNAGDPGDVEIRSSRVAMDGAVYYESGIRIAVPQTAQNTLRALFRIIPKALEEQGYLEEGE